MRFIYNILHLFAKSVKKHRNHHKSFNFEYYLIRFDFSTHILSWTMDCTEIITECKAINRRLSPPLRNISPIQEMIHTYTKFSKDKRDANPETSIGIWNKYWDVARNYDERFLNRLEKKKQNEITILT